MTEAMLEAEVMLEKDLMKIIEEDTLFPEAQDNQGSETNPDPLTEDIELHQGLPAEIMVDFAAVDNLVILSQTVQ